MRKQVVKYSLSKLDLFCYVFYSPMQSFFVLSRKDNENLVKENEVSPIEKNIDTEMKIPIFFVDDVRIDFEPLRVDFNVA